VQLIFVDEMLTTNQATYS